MKKLLITSLLLTLLSSCNKNENYITYKEYIDIVNNEQDTVDVFAFVSSYCNLCSAIKPCIKKYQKGDNKYKLYMISIDSINNKYKDSSMGIISGNVESDGLKCIDNRLNQFVISTSISNIQTQQIGYYKYVSTPLIVFYKNKKESSFINNYDSYLSYNSKGEIDYTSFKEMIDNYNPYDFDLDFNLTSFV